MRPCTPPLEWTPDAPAVQIPPPPRVPAELQDWADDEEPTRPAVPRPRRPPEPAIGFWGWARAWLRA